MSVSDLAEHAVPAVLSRPAPRAAQWMRLFVPERALRTMLLGSLVAAAVAYPFYADRSLWLAVGTTLTVFVIWHSLVASRTVPWLPGLTAATACVQWILAPWVAYELSQGSGSQRMAVESHEYFAYAVPVTLALVIGLYLPLSRRIRHVWNAPAADRISRQLRQSCEVMVFGGLAIRFALPFAPQSLRFAVLLLAQLSYVGLFALVLARVPGWKWRALLVFLPETYYNAVDAQFLGLMLWMMFLSTLFIFRYRPRARTLLAAGLVAMLGLFALNTMKSDYRTMLRTTSVDLLDRPAIAARALADQLASPFALLAGESLALNIARLNQGWIISRVMVWVPASEPYAEGETLVAAIRAALLPRFLDPTKASAGGRVNFPRFTGLTLVGATSMNLGLAGEMFANFGRQRAFIAVGIYGLLLGGLFRVFVRWSRQSPLWWSWAPLIMFTTISAEMSTIEIFNQATKAFLIMLAVTTLVPGWALLRRWKLQRRIARITSRRRVRALNDDAERLRWPVTGGTRGS